MQLVVQRLIWAALILSVPLLLLLFPFHNQISSCNAPINESQRFHQPQFEESCQANEEASKNEKRLKKLWASRSWKNKVDSTSALFRGLEELVVLSQHSKALCISAGIGQEVMALRQMDVEGAIGIEVVESPPLVIRGDAHKHPFGDSTFDLEFSSHLSDALFPGRFVSEMERTLKPRGHALILVPPSYPLDQISALFNSSQLVMVQRDQHIEIVDVSSASEDTITDPITTLHTPVSTLTTTSAVNSNFFMETNLQHFACTISSSCETILQQALETSSHIYVVTEYEIHTMQETVDEFHHVCEKLARFCTFLREITYDAHFGSVALYL